LFTGEWPTTLGSRDQNSSILRSILAIFEKWEWDQWKERSFFIYLLLTTSYKTPGKWPCWLFTRWFANLILLILITALWNLFWTGMNSKPTFQIDILRTEEKWLYGGHVALKYILCICITPTGTIFTFDTLLMMQISSNKKS
jgi:hypothetical protein